MPYTIHKCREKERADNEHVLKACDGLLALVVSPAGCYVLRFVINACISQSDTIRSLCSPIMPTVTPSYCRSGLTVCLHLSRRTVEVG